MACAGHWLIDGGQRALESQRMQGGGQLVLAWPYRRLIRDVVWSWGAAHLGLPPPRRGPSPMRSMP
eukprot:9869992-Karenia_brevis.AAC.1